MCCLTKFLFFDIPLLYCYTKLNWSINSCLSSGHIYLFWEFYFIFCNSLGDFFETLVILSAILLAIRSPVASAVFWIALFEAVFCLCCRFFSAIKKFLILFIAQIFTYVFRKGEKIYILTCISRFNWIGHFYAMELHSMESHLVVVLLNCWRKIYSVFCFYWLTIFICKPYFNGLEFWVECF